MMKKRRRIRAEALIGPDRYWDILKRFGISARAIALKS